MKVGDRALVPRTGGGTTPGEIIEMYTNRAVVKFRVGETYRGKPAPEKFQEANGYKTVPIEDLKLIKEA
jgi:hypothetical protein